MLTPWLVGTIISIGKLLYPSDPDIAYKTPAGPVMLTAPEGPVMWTAPEGPLNIVEIEGVPIDLGNRGATYIPFNSGAMGLPPTEQNKADAASEIAKEDTSPAPQYHPAFLRLYPDMNACYQDQLVGKQNHDGTQGCKDCAARGDMSKLVFFKSEKDDLPVIDRIPKEIPQEAKSDLIKYLEWKEKNTYTIRDWLTDSAKKFRTFLYDEGKKSGEAAGKGMSETMQGMAGSVGAGFGKGILDPLVEPDPDASGTSGINTTMIIVVGGGVLLLILLMRR